MAQLTNLKAYVLTIPESKRLVNGKISGYPQSLPTPELFYGITPKDLKTPIPQWYVRKHYVGTWCCAKSKLALIKHHYETNPDSDLLLLEDDVSFNVKFDYMFKTFIEAVPDDWGMIFLGGMHRSVAIRVNDLVLRAHNIVNNECVIFNHKILPKLIEELDIEARHKRLASDQVIASLMSSIPTYTPLVRFAGQRTTYSFIRGKLRKGFDSFVMNGMPKYVDFDGTERCATYKEIVAYLADYMKIAVVDIPVFGGIGNCLYFIAYGKWLRTFGITVNFIDRTMWGPQTVKFIKDKTGESLIKRPPGKFKFHKEFHFKVNCSLYHSLYDCLINDKVVTIKFYPELRNFIDLGNIELKPIIGINVRRGDFLSPRIKNKNPGFIDLCSTKYYQNAAKIANDLGLRVRIISDELDKIPKEIIALFDDPELFHGTFEEDFYKLAECQYKFISNSTFAYWAAYAAPDATVFYPKGCRDDIKLDNWIPIELSLQYSEDNS